MSGDISLLLPPWSALPCPHAGVCDVSKRACLTLLGAGKSVMIAVGGGTEVRLPLPGTAYVWAPYFGR